MQAKLLTAVGMLFWCAQVAAAQAASDTKPTTDAEKLADALRAGPTFITQNATILDWPSSPGGEYRVLRKGSTEWTCLPGVPGYTHDEPACLDPTFLKWIQESLAGQTPHIDRVGIAYMYVGAYVPNRAGKAVTSSADFHVGPHVMIISPHQDEVQAFSRDGSTGQPYVAHLPNGTQLYLVMPYQQADQQ